MIENRDEMILIECENHNGIHISKNDLPAKNWCWSCKNKNINFNSNVRFVIDKKWVTIKKHEKSKNDLSTFPLR